MKQIRDAYKAQSVSFISIPPSPPDLKYPCAASSHDAHDDSGRRVYDDDTLRVVSKNKGASYPMLVFPPRDLSNEELRAMKTFTVEPTFLEVRVLDQCSALDHGGLAATMLNSCILDIDRSCLMDKSLITLVGAMQLHTYQVSVHFVLCKLFFPFAFYIILTLFFLPLV